MQRISVVLRAAAVVASVAAPPLGANPLANSVRVKATVSTTYDANAGLYTYSYSFTNDAASPLDVDTIMIPLNGSSVVNVTAPTGWSGGVWFDGTVADFSTTEVVVPPGWVNDGNIPPSPYQIPPGQTLSGFSFQSPDPPGRADFHAQGYTRLPEVGVNGEEPITSPGVKPPDPLHPSESFKGTTEGPVYSEQLYTGGPHPPVDGFLVVTSPQNGASVGAPLQVDITFAASGVDQATFQATLNNQDVTSAFQTLSATTRRAVFAGNHPWLNHKGPRNVVMTLVREQSMGLPSTVTDIDRIVVNVK